MRRLSARVPEWAGRPRVNGLPTLTRRSAGHGHLCRAKIPAGATVHLVDARREESLEIVQLSASLSLEQALSPWRELRGIIRAVTGDEGSEVESQPFDINNAARKQRVVLRVRAISVIDEGMGDIADGVVRIVEVLDTIHGVSSIPAIQTLESIAMFIQPRDVPFHEAVAAVKEAVWTQADIIDEATDVGLVVDFDDGTRLGTLTVGPMSKQQLQDQYLKWPNSELPEVFVYLAATYRQPLGAYDSTRLGEAMRAAAAWQTEQTKRMVAVLT